MKELSSDNGWHMLVDYSNSDAQTAIKDSDVLVYSDKTTRATADSREKIPDEKGRLDR
jgi:hypothetical protein